MTEKILIVIESGIGNAIFLTPLIKSLHKAFDKPEVTLLSSSYRKEGKIVEGWKYLKDCIYTAKGLNHGDFDRILISPMYGSNFNYFLKAAPKNKLIPITYGQGIDWNREHEIDVNMRPVLNLGFSGKAPPTEVVTKKPKKVPKLIKSKLKVGFHTGCYNHPNYDKKKWAGEQWLELAKKLEKDFNAQIIWFGAGKDYSSSEIGLDLVNKFEDVRETAYMINQCDLFITLDSGLSHIANALFKPMIVLFGPTMPSKNRPWNPGYTIVSSNKTVCKNIPCYFTPQYDSCKDNQCMKQINVSDIIPEVKICLKKKKKIKICLVACRQLGESLNRVLEGMEHIEFFQYDYQNENYNFADKVRDFDLIFVLHGAINFNLEMLKNISAKKILWFNDNVCRYVSRLKEMAPYFDEIFTINKDNKLGMDFVPCGIDDTQFFDQKLDRDIDVSFIGNLYTDKRIRWLTEIRKSLNVSHFQDLSYDRYTGILNRSKITINEHYNEFGANMRFYEAIGCKSLMITDKVIGIPPDFQEGIHYLTYESVPDLIKKVKYYLEHEEERLKIAEAAYSIAMKRHKYSDRINQILGEVRLL